MLKIYKINYSFEGTGEALVEAKTKEEAQMKFEDNERIPNDGERTQTTYNHLISSIEEYKD